MTPLPFALTGAADLVCWRVDRDVFASTWDSGMGAAKVGGRWNSRGTPTVYCSLDPATAILEVAVHKTFRELDIVPHFLSAATILNPSDDVHVVNAADIPNPHWLHPTPPSAGQQSFGDNLMSAHTFVVLPSAPSSHSWNLIFNPIKAKGLYRLRLQERLAIDPRLNPPLP